MMTAATSVELSDESTGGRLVSVDGQSLPLLGVTVTARARGGIARTVLEQRFRNPSADPLRVTYLFPLPHDGAVSGFAFRIGDRRIVGEIDRKQAARERFEEAIASGHSAAIVDQERGSLFTQELGNVPPGTEVVAELTVDQKLAWLPTGAWEWRFPTKVAPRYQGVPGRVTDASRVEVEVANAPLAPRLTLAFTIADALAEERRPESPSHDVRFRPEAGLVAATLATPGGAALDRDVVVRWPVAAAAVGTSIETFRAATGPLAGSGFGLLTLVPPAVATPLPALPRDLVVLLDTSGSMSGEPLDQARHVVSALVDSLGGEDTVELIEFSDAPRRWKAKPVRTTLEARRSALAWLAKLEAGGSTEMREAIVEALRPVRKDAQRQVVLVTDGCIGFESEVVSEVLAHLPAGSRLHTLGVGSSVNRSLTAPAARAGRGTESIVGLREDPERAAYALVAHTATPLVTDLEITGDAVIEHAPARLPDLFGGSPALVALRLRPEGGDVRVSGNTPGGKFERTVHVRPLEAGAGEPRLAALFGREAVEDLETRLAAGERAKPIDAAIEKLGLELQISTRLTSWVAISEEPTVDPRAPTRRVKVPHELPYGMSVERLGLRHALASRALLAACPPPARGFGVLYREAIGPLKRTFAMLDQKANAPLDADETPAAPPPTLGFARSTRGGLPPSRQLGGRVTFERDGKIVVEMELDAPLAWHPPEEVSLVFADGSSEAARVVERLSTGAGRLEAGQTLRLVLARDATGAGAATDLERVELLVEGQSVVISLARSGQKPGRGGHRLMRKKE